MDKTLIKIGWIGTGIMGKSMAGHLIKNGYKVLIHNRSPAKAESLVQMGAEYFENPQEIAKQVDYLVTMVGNTEEVDRTLFGEIERPGSDLISYLKKGATIIDHTSSSPVLAERIFAECKIRGLHAIDAPVSGGEIGAKAGKLIAMAGGDKKIVEKASEIMKSYASEISVQGKPGSGQHKKVANQIMVYLFNINLCEALIYSHKAGPHMKAGLVQLLK